MSSPLSLLTNQYNVHLPTLSKIMFLEICIFLFFQFPMTILFGWFSNDPSHYGMKECKVLLEFSRNFFYIMILTSFFSGIINPVLFCFLVKVKEQTKKLILGKTMKSIRIMLMITGFVSYCFLFIAYLKDENCGDLSEITHVYIEIVSTAIAFIIGTILFLICFRCINDPIPNLNKENLMKGEEINLTQSEEHIGETNLNINVSEKFL